MEVLLVQADGQSEPAAPLYDGGKRYHVLDVGPDGALYGTSAGSVIRYDSSQWTTFARPEDLGPEIAGQRAFTVVDVAPNGDVYAATTNGVAKVSPSDRRWLVQPTRVGGVITRMEKGAIAPPNPTAQILDLEAGSDGVVVVTADQVRHVNGEGVSRVILDSQTGSTSEAATIAAKKVDDSGGATSCCTGATSFAAAARSPLGMLYVLDATAGRLLRLPEGGPVTLAVGPPGTETKGCKECLPPSRTFGERADRAADAASYPLIPVLVGSAGGVLAFKSNGNLLVALGSIGLVEVAAVDDLPGR